MLQRKQFVKKTKKGNVLKVGKYCQLRSMILAIAILKDAYRLLQDAVDCLYNAGVRCTLFFKSAQSSTVEPGNDACNSVDQIVREHYLRDDIQSGTPLDPKCPQDSQKLSKDARHYLVVDTNIALQQVS